MQVHILALAQQEELGGLRVAAIARPVGAGSQVPGFRSKRGPGVLPPSLAAAARRGQ